MREAFESLGVVDDEGPGVGGIEDVLGELLGDGGELGLDLGDAFLLVGGEVGAGVAEVGAGFLDVAGADGIEGFGVVGIGIGSQDFPESGVEGDRGGEGGDGGQHLVECLALFVGVADRVEVVEASPAAVEGVAGFIEGGEGVLVGLGARGDGADGGEIGFGFGDGGVDVDFDPFRGEEGPADMEFVG